MIDTLYHALTDDITLTPLWVLLASLASYVIGIYIESSVSAEDMLIASYVSDLEDCATTEEATAMLTSAINLHTRSGSEYVAEQLTLIRKNMG